MLDLVQQIINAKRRVQEDPDATVTISLPLDDYRAETLLKFARKLMIPTTRIHESGLTTQTGISRASNTEEFLIELNKTLGDELYYELMVDLKGQLGIAKDNREEQISSDPSFLPKAIHALGKAGKLAEMPHAEKMANVADSLLKNPVQNRDA